MKHLIDLFLARGMKFTDLFLLGGGAIAIFIVAVGIGRLFDSYRKRPDPWDHEPWI